MNCLAANYGASKTAGNETSFGEYDPTGFNGCRPKIYRAHVRNHPARNPLYKFPGFVPDFDLFPGQPILKYNGFLLVFLAAELRR
jgi:hypothetical protein